MMGLECTGDVPFREVHMHGLVRDAERQKMSKTKGNVVDPLELMDRFGTDAVRIALLISAAPGADIALKEDRMEASRAFANKLWNASRLLFLNMERSKLATWTPPQRVPTTYIEDAWILGRLNLAIILVNDALIQHRYHEAVHELWHFIWHQFCDWYLEVKKLRFRESSGQDEHWTAALRVYEVTLRLLHPFMPFLTEELWQRLVHDLAVGSHQVSVSLERYPSEFQQPPADDAPFVIFQNIVTKAREFRADGKFDPKKLLSATLVLRDYEFSSEDVSILSKVTKLNIRQFHSSELPDVFELKINSTDKSATSLNNGALAPEARERIAKEITAQQRAIENSKRQLSNPSFLRKAPEKVIANLRRKLADYESQLAENTKLLEGLE